MKAPMTILNRAVGVFDPLIRIKLNFDHSVTCYCTCTMSMHNDEQGKINWTNFSRNFYGVSDLGERFRSVFQVFDEAVNGVAHYHFIDLI